MVTYSHVTVRMARFADAVTLPELPDGDDESQSLWRLGSDDMGSGQRIGSRTARDWCLLGLHRTEQAARDAVHQDGAVHSVLDGATERWVALLQPYSHRGETNWSPEPLFAAGNRRSHDGPFVVMTTVGFDPTLDPRLERTRAFIHGTAAVRASFADTPGLAAAHVFWFGQTWTDPFTLTVWNADDALRPPVYEPGEHRSRMDDYHRNQTADRSSFTRLRVLESTGTWNDAPLIVASRPEPGS